VVHVRLRDAAVDVRDGQPGAGDQPEQRTKAARLSTAEENSGSTKPPRPSPAKIDARLGRGAGELGGRRGRPA
jgi:hypothetical protein